MSCQAKMSIHIWEKPWCRHRETHRVLQCGLGVVALGDLHSCATHHQIHLRHLGTFNSQFGRVQLLGTRGVCEVGGFKQRRLRKLIPMHQSFPDSIVLCQGKTPYLLTLSAIWHRFKRRNVLDIASWTFKNGHPAVSKQRKIMDRLLSHRVTKGTVAECHSASNDSVQVPGPKRGFAQCAVLCAALVDMKTRTRMVTRQLWLFTLSYKWIPSGRSFGQLNHISKSVCRTVSKTDPRLNPQTILWTVMKSMSILGRVLVESLMQTYLTNIGDHGPSSSTSNQCNDGDAKRNNQSQGAVDISAANQSK